MKPSEANTGVDSGTAMRKKQVSSFAPSILAASNSDSGRLLKNVRYTMVFHAPPMKPGRM